MGIFDWKHWIVILVVVVLIFGTKKLKTVGADVGASIKSFRRAMNDDDTTTQEASTPTLSQAQVIEGNAHKVVEPSQKG